MALSEDLLRRIDSDFAEGERPGTGRRKQRGIIWHGAAFFLGETITWPSD